MTNREYREPEFSREEWRRLDLIWLRNEAECKRRYWRRYQRLADEIERLVAEAKP